ncbi:MAG: hypothetical protein CUN54_08400 [Phototrophicales bacterium]|nr:MAG: hypothetical protein CUN54_08400 [Phototrophicales bacterium]
MPKQFSAVGTEITFWGFLKAGIVHGTNGNLVDGQDSAMGQLLGVSDLGLALPEGRTIDIGGDNSNRGSIELPPNASPSGQLLTTVNNPTFVAAAQGGLISTEDGLDLYLQGVPCPDNVPLTIIHNAPAQRQDAGFLTETGYEITIYLFVKVQPRGRNNIQDSQNAQYTHRIVGNYADKLPWGELLTAVKFGKTRAIQIGPFFSDFPMTMHTYIGDGSIGQSVTLAHTPAGTTAAEVRVYNANTGAKKTITTDYTVAGNVVTFVTDPAAGEQNVIFYQFPPDC